MAAVPSNANLMDNKKPTKPIHGTRIRFPEPTKTQLRSEAHDMDRSLNSLVVSICKEYLKQCEKERNKK